MKRLVLAAIGTVALTGCGSTPDQAAAPPAVPVVTTPAPTGHACPFKPTRDMLERDVSPGVAPYAMRLGNVDLIACKSTLATFPEGAPKGAGFCTTIAWASDNPGYDENAEPAKPLKHVLLMVGGGC